MLISKSKWSVGGLLVAVIMLLLLGTQPAQADSGDGNDCSGGVVVTCGVGVSDPGSPGAPGGHSGAPVGFTPAPTTCSYQGKDVPCHTDDGWWENGGNCTGYVKLADPQTSPPPGENAGVGAWYWCAAYCPPGSIRDCFGATFWSNTPPPGIDRYTPAQAAALLVKSFQLTGINIGMAPDDKTHTDDPAGTAPYRRTWVGIPVWLWVQTPQPLTFGPYSKTATLGGVTVTATAAVSSITWSSGDGQSVTCGAGTAFHEAAAQDQLATDSPTCGFRYQKTSGSGTFTVAATSHWVVRWTGGGTNGTIAVPTTQSATKVHVGELQSVNTVNSSNGLG